MSFQTIADADFERRWAAWLKRGRARDRLVYGRLRIALPVAALLMAAGYFLLR